MDEWYIWNISLELIQFRDIFYDDLIFKILLTNGKFITYGRKLKKLYKLNLTNRNL